MAGDSPSALPVQLVEQPRLQKLKEMFISKFGSAPKFYARAPGRVNLIGEHIDYCGYAVLPMAIEQDILIAVEPVQTQVVQLANTNSSYLDFSTSVNNIQINKTKPQWHNYFLCGLKGIQEHFGLNNPTGMNCLLDGTIPPSSGLSSSSALVCCAGLVTLRANGKTLSKVELAEICTKSERYIGTEGGGMDQSISFLAEEGTAKLIEFSPLRATDVRLPSGATFVIANSCVEMNKAATSHYNIRVMECRLATKLLSKSKGLEWRKMLRLHDVQTKLGVSLEEMLTIVEEVLHPEPYSAEEICKCLGISLEELHSQILSQNMQDVSTFKLYQRAKHVYSEAARVLEFQKICCEAPANALQLLGELMKQSHISCREMYECSCPELDRLVDICLAGEFLCAWLVETHQKLEKPQSNLLHGLFLLFPSRDQEHRQFGAIGSRLTGAGWGGCTVSMVPTDKLNTFLKNVKKAYYQTDGQRLAVDNNSLFATKPGRGALVFAEA
ncbi:N-acetylgalactosamine kinase isoform X1 [Onychostruthus taczanowskii]|uniref:N-acetylgalactosamine kinase isoform X1 n=1 Tax=Onychostruthus taczanowskii TaxID=356909 RepID=UPI001B80B132|nr:N-acetylgalactosamine kinase isoform X1 [Onychostruthus taczanowskii]